MGMVLTCMGHIAAIASDLTYWLINLQVSSLDAMLVPVQCAMLMDACRGPMVSAAVVGDASRLSGRRRVQFNVLKGL